MSVVRLARRFLPSPVRTPLRRMLVSVRDYRQARHVLRAYSRHYLEARRQYDRERQGTPATAPSLADVGVRTIRPDSPSPVLPLPPNYSDLVERLHRDVAGRLSWTANCRFFPAPASAVLPDRSDDVDDVRRGETITIQLLQYLNLDGLEELCAHLVPEIERAVYGSHVLVDKVYVYRSPVSHQRPQASWVWHYDEHPREVLKLMIYLTDVAADTAPFMYLAADDAGEAVMGARTPLYGQSRISAARMAAYAAKGFRGRAVTGPRGTLVLFNDSVIHRATLAERAHRDVVVLQMRPIDTAHTPFVDPRWTGSFQNLDFNRDPSRVEPLPWPHAATS